jgi:Flp pilus assembly protein TadD
MSLQEQYDAAMFAFSRGEFGAAVGQLKQVLAQDPTYFDAQLALGMAHYRLGDFATAIAEGHKAEQLRPKEQLAHTNLSLFYMKSGDKVTAEHHGLQARIAGWRAENAAAQAPATGSNPAPEAASGNDSELQMARPKPPPVKVMRMPDKFPEQPWKKKRGVEPEPDSALPASGAPVPLPHAHKET